MKKTRLVILILVVMFCFQGALSQSFMFGLGASYGTDIKQFAPNARIYYGLNEHICIGPEYSYFLSTTHGDYQVQLSEYGFVAHYIFEIKERVGLFPLLGFNYSVEKESHNGESEKVDAFAASFGGGFHVNIGNWLPYAEYKFITGKLSQSTISVGLLYNLHFGSDKHSEKEHH